MKDLRISMVQVSLTWEDPEQNRRHISTHLESIKDTDLVVLPEMFTTGFSMEPSRIAEKFDAENMTTLAWMREWSNKLNAVITGSIAAEENGKYYNRLMWVRPGGGFSTYDKRHLFRMSGEHLVYSPGESISVFNVNGWKISPLICYDLRFPVWSRNRLDEGNALYDVLLYTANWPAVRIQAWLKLLQARAIENQAYTIGTNRVGVDGNSIEYSGHSVVIDARGEIIAGDIQGKETVVTHHLSWNALHELREKFPVLHDADNFELDSTVHSG